MYSKEVNRKQKKLYEKKKKFIALLFIIVENWKPLICLNVGKWFGKMWYNLLNEEMAITNDIYIHF